MFQFLVRYQGWSQGQESLPVDRVFKYTDTDVEHHFRNGNAPNVQALSAVPALFASETGGKGSQYARIGQVLHAESQGTQMFIQYSLDQQLEPIPNAELQRLAPINYRHRDQNAR